MSVPPVPPGDPAYWDEVAEGTDRLPAGWRRHARRAHLELLAAWVGVPEGRWLKTDLFEERSPHRALLPSLRDAGWVGIDLSARVAVQARAGVGATGVVADVRALPFAACAFDGVLSTSTLDHFRDEADLHVSLRELRRVLRPGGVLFLTLDNPANPLIRLRNALPRAAEGRTRLSPFAVGHTLGADAGRAALEAAGFAVEHTSHLLHAPHVIGTRLARWGWYERRVLPRIDAAFTRRAGRTTGHYVAWLARAR